MLKEYTIKVTCHVGGETEDECEHKLYDYWNFNTTIDTWEITHEEIVEKEVERE